MTTDQLIEELTKLLSKLADNGFVDESWKIQTTVDKVFPVKGVNHGQD